MKKAEVVVLLITLYAVLFQLAPFLGFPDEVLYTMFILSPFLIVYMVYIVLKFGEPSKHSFDDRFYDDWPYRRNGKEELDNKQE